MSASAVPIMEIWSDRAAIAVAATMHLAATRLAILEARIALMWSWLQCSRTSARAYARSFFQFRPASEGGLIVLGQVLGLEPGVALALFLVKRVPDIVLGAPALLSWVGLEARHAVRKWPEHGARLR
jgi:hypothetical protein